MRHALLTLLAAALPASSFAADRAACLASTTPEALLQNPVDSELYDYAACAELINGRNDMCDAFPGGPASSVPPDDTHEVVHSDGKVHLESLYSVCYTRAAAYRFLSLLVKGAPEAELLPQMKLLLYGEDLPAEEVLRDYVGIYRAGSLDAAKRPELARIGFFNHVLGKKACESIKLPGLKRECVKKAAALEAIKAGDSSRCLKDDFLCHALLEGKGVCRKIGARIVKRYCEQPEPARRPADSPAT